MSNKEMINHFYEVIVTENRKTYPNCTMKIIRQYAENDYVISEFIMQGIHEGEEIDMKPTYKTLTLNLIKPVQNIE